MAPEGVAENRVVVRVRDGLGNQLFQYALGRRLAIDRGARLFLDAIQFSPANVMQQPHRLALCDFQIEGDLTQDARWSGSWVKKGLAGALLWRLEQRVLPRQWRRFVQEDPSEYKTRRSTFAPEILKVGINVYLLGWWVSPRYFEGIEDVLRDELVLGQRSQDLIGPQLHEIAHCGGEAVSIHVRRGDFLKHPDIGVLGPEYYGRAIEIIRERVANPRFFVFSDDVPAARQILGSAGLVDFECVELPHDVSPACDLWLMAACNHFINANSTFSWWGAWLSRNPGRVVVVPEHWYVGARIAIDDVYLRDWIRVAD